MSLPVFIYDLEAHLNDQEITLPREGESVKISGSEGRHAVSVKRLSVGEQIELMDTHGAKAVVTITSVSGKDTLTGRVEEVIVSQPAKPKITIAQAIPKSERSELAVDLLTQGGADCIIPWEAKRCVAKWQGNKRDKGVQKWRQAAIAAAKQSRRATVPRILDPVNSTELVEIIKNFDTSLVLHETAAVSLKTVLGESQDRPVEEMLLIIGPEGGVSEEEAEQFRNMGATAVKLGPEVLRTASAGLVALAAIGFSTDRW